MEPRTKEQARAMLKTLGLLKTHRVLEGKEREKTFTMLRLMPSTQSNNQHLWCESWTVGNIQYDHVTGNGVDELVEITDDESTHQSLC
jgi:hypothetical protein